MYLSNEDVANSIDRLGRRRSHCALHEPCQLQNNRLHDAHVVQHRDDAAEEDDHRHDLQRNIV